MIYNTVKPLKLLSVSQQIILPLLRTRQHLTLFVLII